MTGRMRGTAVMKSPPSKLDRRERGGVPAAEPVAWRMEIRCSRCGRCSRSTARHFHVWQIVTYAFLHEYRPTSAHLAVQHAGLWMFGAEVERYVGAAAPARLLFRLGGHGGAHPAVRSGRCSARRRHPRSAPRAACSVCCSPTPICFRPQGHSAVPADPMPAWLFAALYAGWSSWLGVTGTLAGVAHFAHLGRHGGQRDR
jgi:hypothetical protein